MQHLEGSGTPVLYIGRTVLKPYTKVQDRPVNLATRIYTKHYIILFKIHFNIIL